MSQSIDIAVVGTGPVGLAAALGLQKMGYKVALLGQLPALTPALQDANTWDPRVYALTPDSQRYLTGLGVWPALDPARLAPVRDIEVAQSASARRVLFESASAQLDRLATIVEHSHLVATLAKAIQFSGVALLPSLPVSLTQSDECCQITLANQNQLTAKLVVAADGALSKVRQLAQIEVTQKTYDQMAVVATLACAVPHRGLARQWFSEQGVIALLPLPDPNAINLVWSAPTVRATELADIDNSAFALAVTSASAAAFGELTLLGQRQSVPLQNQRSKQLVGQRVVLTGDAAHVIHPMAGHGLNLGFGDIQQLQTILSRQPKADPGVRMLLRQYERSRKEPIAVMSRVTDGLFKVFFDAPSTLTAFREIGWSLVSQSSALKRTMIRHASTN